MMIHVERISDMKEYILNSKDAIRKQNTNSITKGWLLKWKLNDTWLKAPGFLYNYMYESYAEIIASVVAHSLGIDRCIQYKPCILVIDGIRVLGCESKDYKGDNKEITFSKLANIGEINDYRHSGYTGYKELIKEFKQKYSINLQSYLEDVILLDSIILNTDRNMWNLSVLVNKRNKVIECPIYDNGTSLGLDGLHSGMFEEKYMYDNGFRAEPFDIYFENQAKYIRNDILYLVDTPEIERAISYFEVNFCENNKYNVVNTLQKGQIQFVKTLIASRLNTIVRNRLCIIT